MNCDNCDRRKEMPEIILKETKEFLRDKTYLFFFLLFPAMLVFLLGNILSSQDNADAAIGAISIQYYVEAKDPQSAAGIDDFARAISDGNTIKMEKTEDLAASQAAVKDNSITAVVVFLEPAGIQIYEGRNSVGNRTVAAIMNGFALTNKAVLSASQISPASLQDGGSVEGIAADGNSVGAISDDAMSIDRNFVTTKDLGVNRTILDYYAISMLTMITFVSLISGTYAFTRERDNKTMNRLILSPGNRWSLYIQKILGTIPQIISQTIVLMLVSVFLFHAHYAATWKGNLFLFGMFFCVALALISLGAFIGLFLKTEPTATLMPILWIAMFFGGTFTRMVNIKEVTPYLPNYIVQNAAFDITLFGRYGMGLQVIAVSAVLFAATLTAGVLVFNRKEEQ